MTTTLGIDSPWIASARAEGVPDAVLADWLYDQGARAADLALLLAGTPPAHADGITRECLALWLERHGQDGQARAVRAEPLAGWWQDTRARGLPGEEVWHFSALAHAPTAAEDLHIHISIWGHADDWLWRSSLGGISDRAESREEAFARAGAALDLAGYARRNLLRRLLSLPWAAGVRVKRTRVSAHDPDGAPFEAVIRADLDAQLRPGVRPAYSLGRDPDGNSRWSAEQTLTAPQLVWPEAVPRASPD